jgi:hypothetical protein
MIVTFGLTVGFWSNSRASARARGGPLQRCCVDVTGLRQDCEQGLVAVTHRFERPAAPRVATPGLMLRSPLHQTQSGHNG